jgi:hypothetical protein
MNNKIGQKMKKIITINKIIINQETLLNSIIKDVVSVSALILLLWFNYNLLNNSYFVQFLVFLTIIIYLCNNPKLNDYKSYHNISVEKIERVKKILEENV